ncbi:MAG: hypothetical protein IKJ35_09685 [Clostridia bacterium]|nr:hypothetical protein [Clostridia bacterium]
MEKDLEGRGFPAFYPTLEGCVARDLRFAAALEESYMEELGAVAAYTYRSLLWARREPDAAALFERLAKEEMLHFRMLGELILALGGNPVIQANMRVQGIERDGRSGIKRESRGRAALYADSIREERRGIDRYQTLMGRTQDRVVRSVLAHLLSDEHRHVEALCREQKGDF